MAGTAYQLATNSKSTENFLSFRVSKAAAIDYPRAEIRSKIPSVCGFSPMLQNVENFALRTVTKRWDAGYQELLDMAALPSSESRRLQSSLCMLYKIVHNLCYFPSNIITPM